MEDAHLRSDCPINFALEMIGDKWSLLIVRDIALAGKHSYNEFLHAGEGIATNILSNRLATLEADGIINKKRDSNNRAKYVYTLTPRGLDLIPLLVDVMLWTDSVTPVHGVRKLAVDRAKADRNQLIHDIRAHLESGAAGSFESTLV